MSGAGKKPIDALKAKFIYPAMLISALNFSACKSDKKTAETEQGTDSPLAEYTISNDTLTAKQHFDSLKKNTIEAENNKISKEDNLHYDDHASLNGFLTNQMNALGPGFPVSKLKPVTPLDSFDVHFDLFAIEFFYADDDKSKTGKNFKGYIPYYGVDLAASDVRFIVKNSNKGFYEKVMTVKIYDEIQVGNPVPEPMTWVLTILDKELKQCKNVVIDGQILKTKDEVENFIQGISRANGTDLDALRNRKPGELIDQLLRLDDSLSSIDPK